MRRLFVKRRWIRLGAPVAAVVALAAIFVIWDHSFRIPNGPPLPPEVDKRTFSSEVINLNNGAGKFQIEDPAEALRLYDEALRLDPEYYVAYANKGTLLMCQGDYDQAAECFGRASKLCPRTVEYYMGHAACLHQLGDEGKAQDVLMYALSACNAQLAETPANARLSRAYVLYLLGRDSVAYRELRRLRDEQAGGGITVMVDGFKGYFDEHRDGNRWSMLLPDSDQ